MSGGDLICGICQKPSSFRCGRCRRVAYCSKEHQKLDWKVHKVVCSDSGRALFEIAENKELGRHLISARSIAEGEVILQEVPLVSGPQQLTPPLCLGCYKALDKLNRRDCSLCGWPVCSVDCEKSSMHRPECEITRKYKKSKVKISSMYDGLDHPSYLSITVLRCLHLRSSNVSSWEKLSKLESHWDDIKSVKKYESDLVMIARFIHTFFNFQQFTEEEIMKVVGIIQVNAHCVPLTEPGFISIYDVASLLEHNCQANCSKSFAEDGKIMIRAARAIQPGEHLSISYTEPLWGVETRRNYLLSTKFFLCKCQRCTDPTEFGTHFNSMRCTSGGCDGFAVPTFASPPSWKCSTCGKAHSAEELDPVIKAIKDDTLKMDRKNAIECREFLNKYEKDLHPNHYLLVDVKLSLILCYDEEKLMNAEEGEILWVVNACRTLNGLTARLVPAENRLRGILYFHLHYALSEIGRRKTLSGEMDDDEMKRSLTMYRDVLKKAYNFLKWEPEAFQEGKMAIECLRYVQDLNGILEGTNVV